MEATVTMKMTPDEHRLIREVVIEARDETNRIMRENEVPHGDGVRNISPQERVEIRAKQVHLNDLLAKL